MQKILFVDTGNSGRSPMAEALFRQQLGNRLDMEVSSAGTAVTDEKAFPHAVTVMQERGVDLSGHRPRQVTAKILKESDLVFCMTEGHRDSLSHYFPDEAHKLRLLGEAVPGLKAEAMDVKDPHFGSVEEYRATRNVLRDAMPHVEAAADKAGLYASLANAEWIRMAKDSLREILRDQVK
ncbi:MAG: hypothetical protein PW734_08820 [Verrucomicrobium sp.]|nr:hypothetical protein [Verrucomicrobium sp.]